MTAVEAKSTRRRKRFEAYKANTQATNALKRSNRQPEIAKNHIAQKRRETKKCIKKM